MRGKGRGSEERDDGVRGKGRRSEERDDARTCVVGDVQMA